jgi:hypothetical protein
LTGTFGEVFMRSDDYRLKIRGADTLVVKGGNRNETGPAPFRRVIYGQTAEGQFMMRVPAAAEPSTLKRDGEARHVGSSLQVEKDLWVASLTRGRFRRGRSLQETLDDPGFRIGLAEEVIRDGRPHVRVEFEFRGHHGLMPFHEEGSFVLAPHLHWAFQEFETRDLSEPAEGRSSHRIEFEFAATGGDLPVVRRVTHAGKIGGTLAVRQVLEVGRWSYRDAPEEEFHPEFYRTARDRP